MGQFEFEWSVPSRRRLFVRMLDWYFFVVVWYIVLLSFQVKVVYTCFLARIVCVYSGTCIEMCNIQTEGDCV